jgi:hypothetical protein
MQTWDLARQAGLGYALVAAWLSKNDDNQGKSLLKPDKKNFKVVRSKLFYCSLPSTSAMP